MFKVEAKDLIGFDSWGIKRMAKIYDMWEAVWATEEFKQRILNFKWEATYTTGRWWWKKTYTEKGDGFYFAEGEDKFTNQEVYDRLMRPLNNFTVTLKRSPLFSKAVAYTDYDSRNVYIYTSWWGNGSITDLLNTNSHETGGHLNEFEHDFEPTSGRPYSVPYAIGDITQELAQKLFPTADAEDENS